MDVVAGGDQVDIPLVIALEGGAVAVVAPAVGFDDDLLDRPEEIDEVALDQNVADRDLRIHLTPEREKVDLRDRFRLQSLGIHFQRDLPQTTDALAAPPAFGDLAQSPPVQMTTLVGLDDNPLQPFRIRPSCKVKQHPLPDSHRDPPLQGDFVLAKSARLMKADPAVMASERESTGLPQHFDRPIRTAHMPKVASIEMGEHCSWPAGKNGTHPPPIATDETMTQGINTLVQRDQKITVASAIDKPLAHPQLE